MSSGSTRLLQGALTALHATRLSALGARFAKGTGVVFMLHHVRPAPPAAPGAFRPNGILEVTPQFLEEVVRDVIAAGFDIVALDEVPARLAAGAAKRPFACFTFDDGYRDNREYAYPIMKRYGVPFTIYVPSDYAEGSGDLWWLTLEKAIAALDEVAALGTRLPARTAAEKTAAFQSVYWRLRAIPEKAMREEIARLAATAGIDVSRQCAELVMEWDELRELASDPLVTIGAHTVGHYAVGRLAEADARREMAEGRARLEQALGRPVRHFSFPYGCEESAGERDFALAAELGFATAVTTRKGLLKAGHAAALTSLPRFSLNGDFQDMRYIRVLLSGVPFALLAAAQTLKAGAANFASRLRRLMAVLRCPDARPASPSTR